MTTPIAQGPVDVNVRGDGLPTMADAIAAGDSVLLNEQAALLRKCRAAFDALANKGGLLMAVEYQCGHERNSIGNLKAELYDYRPQGVFNGDTP